MKYEMWRRRTRNYGPVHLSITTEDVLRDANAERQDGSPVGGGGGRRVSAIYPRENFNNTNLCRVTLPGRVVNTNWVGVSLTADAPAHRGIEIRGGFFPIYFKGFPIFIL